MTHSALGSTRRAEAAHPLAGVEEELPTTDAQRLAQCRVGVGTDEPKGVDKRHASPTKGSCCSISAASCSARTQSAPRSRRLLVEELEQAGDHGAGERVGTLSVGQHHHA